MAGCWHRRQIFLHRSTADSEVRLVVGRFVLGGGVVSVQDVSRWTPVGL